MGNHSRPTRIEWSEEVEDRIVAALKRHGGRYQAAAEGGVDYSTVRRRLIPNIAGEPNKRFDPAFKQRCDEAREEYVEGLIEEARSRAVDGYKERGIFNKDGLEVGEVIKKSDRLLETMLKREDPSFRENVKIEASHTGQIEHQHAISVEKMIRKLSRAGREALQTVLDEIDAANAKPVDDIDDPKLIEGGE
jgi:hypothetical protein